MTAAERHQLIDEMESKGLSRRSACRWSGYSRAIGRYELRRPVQEAEWLEQMRKATRSNPRYGYRRIAVVTGLGFGDSTTSNWPLNAGVNGAANQKVLPLDHTRLNIQTMFGRMIFSLIAWQMESSSKP